ncbi:MAG: SusC/RagA family TonB-linked outer membrane protein, partial [Bacteroidales bacterium]
AQRAITGKVIDDQGLGVAGASVVQKGTVKGTITDADGNYSLTVPEGVVLQISFMGMKTQEVTVGTQSVIDITMKPDAIGVDEVVVTALGIRREQKALGYSVSKIKSVDIVKASNDNIMRSLYGKAPGLQISSNSGSSTSAVKINIRGVNSLGGNNRPLILVDGIPIVDNGGQYSGRNQTDPGSPINDINPEDIESFNVLKGANAAALYGSQAANGVILIETKKGARSQGIGVTFSTSSSFENAVIYENLQNEFGAGRDGVLYQVADANGKPYYVYPGAIDPLTETAPVSSTNMSFGARMDGQNTLWWDGHMRPYSPQVNNVKNIYRQGITSNNTVAIENAWNKGSYRAAFTRKDYQSVIDGHKQGSNTASIALNTQLHKRLKLTTTLNYFNINTTNRPIRTDRMVNYGFPRSEITQMLRDNTVNPDGYLYTDEAYNTNSNVRNNVMFPLFWIMKQRNNTDLKNRLLANAELTFTATDFLSFRLKGGGDLGFTEKENKDPWQSNERNGSRYRKDTEKYAKTYYETMAMFNKKVHENWTLSANVGWSYNVNKNTNVWSSTAGGLNIRDWYSLANTVNTRSSSGSRGEDRLMALFGSGTVNFKDFNFFEFTYRYDQSSILPPESNKYDYWSVSNSFVFSDAFTMPDFFSFGKVRASYALVGLPGSRYYANDTYTYGTFNGVTINSFNSSVPPINLKREMQRAVEFGLETWFWNRRFGLDLTYFHNKNYDNILSLTVPPSSGAENLKANAGEMVNSGIEIALNLVPIQTDNFIWRSTINFSTIKNKVIRLTDEINDFYTIGDPWGIQFRSEVGGSYADIYTYTWERNEKGEKLVDDNGYWIQGTEYKKVGNGLPDGFGGWLNDFTFKNFTFNIALDYTFGGDIVSQTNLWGKGYGRLASSLAGRDEANGGLPYYRQSDGLGGYSLIQLPNHAVASIPSDAYNDPNLLNDEKIVYHDGVILEGVKSDGSSNTTIVSASDAYSNSYAMFNSEDGVFDNSYVKVREMSLSYRIPPQIASRLGMQNASVGVFGRNLFYIYKSVPNIDPESSMGTEGSSAYLEITPYPSTRSFGFNFRFAF